MTIVLNALEMRDCRTDTGYNYLKSQEEGSTKDLDSRKGLQIEITIFSGLENQSTRMGLKLYNEPTFVVFEYC